MSPDRYRQIRCSHTICVDSSTCDLSLVVYVFGSLEMGSKPRLFQVIEISHDAVFPNKSTTISIRVTGEPYNLAPLVDSIGFAVDITGKKTERLHSTFDCPNECLEEVAIRVVRRPGEPDDVALLIDRRRRIPPQSPKVTKVSHPAVFPKYSVLGRMSSDGLVANT
jgi:hypothetical protein